MLGFLSKLFGGSKSEKDVKKIQPIVKSINEYFESYKSLSNDELRGHTAKFRERIAAHLADIDAQIAAKKEEAAANADLQARDAILNEVDKLEKVRDEKLEEVLEQILPEAFATIKEAARRFAESEQVVSTATDLDRQLVSQGRSNLSIDGDQSIYNTTWQAAGVEVTWNMVHYDVQLIGGTVLHQGKIAEMATGEGKTLVSTLPVYLNALAGLGVHVVTVND